MNISFGGIFISTPSPVAEGSHVDLRLRLSGRETPLEIRGLVVRCALGEGMGVGFVDLDPKAETALEELLRTIELKGTGESP